MPDRPLPYPRPNGAQQPRSAQAAGRQRCARLSPAGRRRLLVRSAVVGAAAAVAVGASAIEAATPDASPAPRGAEALAAGGSPLLLGSGGLDVWSSAVAGDPTAPDRAPDAVVPQPRKPAITLDTPIQGGLTARQEQAISSRLIAAHGEVGGAAASDTWTPDLGRTAVARARSWIGMPYSWAAGNGSGPTPGICDSGNGGELDCHVTGFDCSGLTIYAWAPYTSMPHLAELQRAAGKFHPSVDQLRPGDLVFFSGYLPGGIGHVAIYDGDGMVIEAPESGSVVRRSALSELMADDGTYRGATRPLTGATPTLAAPRSSVSTHGAALTLRGSHLAGVESVQVGSRQIGRFVKHTDTELVLHVPGHSAGSVPVVARTGWGADSSAVTLTFTKPKAKPTPRPTPTGTPTRTGSPTGTASPTAPTSPSPSHPAPTGTPASSATGSPTRTGKSATGSQPTSSGSPTIAH